MIGNAHIDPVWLWQWQEGFHEVKATFRSALDRLSEDEGFLFVSSSAAFYEWVEKSDPAMFEEIRRRVSEGRWGIVGGWWIQPDCNIPSGESFVRHALYGQRYFSEKFGGRARVGYNVDSFGHNGMLPQILQKSGMDSYIFMRPSPHEKGLPGRLFWWESDDGARVLAFRLPFEYCTWSDDLEKHIVRCANELKAPLTDIMCFYGVGNHGGGPTRETLASIQRLNADPNMPTLVYSTPDKFFDTIRAQNPLLPIVHDDLQHHASGCYAAHSGIKRWNRRAENALIAAEKLSAVAANVANQPYPADFEQAWKSVLFNQFHDILAGTSLEPAYDDAQHLYGEAMAIADRNLNYAAQALAWNVNIAQEENTRPIVVFNPHAWESRVNVEIEMNRIRPEDVLIDDSGREIRMQVVQSQATANGRSRLSFIADLPALGYRTYRVVRRDVPVEFSTLEASDTVVENSSFRLEFDPETGYIKSLRDKRHNTEVFTGDAATPIVIDDPSDTWSHNVYSFDKAIGAFKAKNIRLVEHGAVKSVIRVVSENGASKLVQDFAVYHDIEHIDVAVTVDWREQFKALKLRFPVNVNFMRVTHEIPYGHIERFANGEEEPMQNWVDVSGTSRDSGDMYGVSILNDSKYSVDVFTRDIGLTVLRSPIYAHHVPAVPDPDGFYSFIDQGIQRFAYTILPHAGSWEHAGTVRRAAELNQKPFALNATYHPGSLPQTASFASVDSENIIISAVKLAEDGSGDVIVRAYETAKIATRAALSVFDRTFEADFGACEIKSFRISPDTAKPVIETNMLEDITE